MSPDRLAGPFHLEEEWAAFLEHYPDFYVRMDRDGRFLSMNRVDDAYDESELLAGTVFDVLPEKDHADMRARLDRVWTTQRAESYQSEVPLASGMRRFRSQIWPIVHDGVVRYLGILALDVTELYEAQAEAREAEARLVAYLNHAPSVVFLKDAAGKHLLVNPPFCELMQLPREALLGKEDLEIFPEEVARKFREKDLQVLETREPLQFEEEVQVGEERRTYLTSKFPVLDDRGDAIGVGGIARDISERKAMEEALRASEESLSITLASILESVIVIDGDERVVRVNPAAAELLGVPEEAAGGRPLGELYAPLDHVTREAIPPVDPDLATTGSRPLRQVLLPRPGVDLRLSENQTALRSREGEVVGAVLVLRDVTEAARLEEGLRQAQKMRALGQLAGGVAHDFNNLLFAVLGNADLLVDGLERAGGDPELVECARAIKTASQRGAGLTRQLLAFARKGLVEERPVDLVRLLDEVVQLLGPTIDKRIRIEVGALPAEAWVRGDAGQLHTALVNLALNARDAMPEGGEICLGLEPTGAGAWEVTVADTGVGIPEGVGERIYEPFFTTKAVGEGVGLGLAAVYGIVRVHRGEIEAGPRPGGGTVFRIRLPAIPAPEEVGDSALPATPGPGEGKTVLLVEDEETVRRVGAIFLRREGFECLEAPDGEAALGILEARGGALDLVVLDLVMPGISGQEVLAEVAARYPDLPVLVATGYNPEEGGGEVLVGARGFIQKPFTARDFRAALEKVLSP